MSEPFAGVVNLDIRDWTPDRAPFSQPVAPPGTPNVVYVVSGTHYVDLEREAVAMLARE